METYTNIGLVNYVKEKIKEPNCYMMGSFGQYVTSDFINQKASMNQHNWYTAERIKLLRTIVGKNVRAWDCIGLIKSYIFNDYKQGNASGYKPLWDIGADGTRGMAKEKGFINVIPEIPGLGVWMPGHIGVYIGNGQVIESTGNTTFAPQEPGTGGICITNLDDRKWNEWIKIPFIEYIENSKPIEITSQDNSDNEPNGHWRQAADGKRWWYEYSDKSYPVKQWKLIDNDWYYFDQDGYMVTGWLLDDGIWYYLEQDIKNKEGHMITGLKIIDGNLYYFNSSGALLENNQVTITLTADFNGKII